MQKNLLLLCAFLLTVSSYAQTIFEQDFSAGIAPMTMVNNDGKVPAANISTYVDAWNIRELTAGNNAALSISWYNPAAAADDWLITPAIEISEAGLFFIWEARAIDGSYADGYEVLVSTTDNELASFTKVFSIGAENTTLTKRLINLDDYAGQTIFIAIRNNSFDKFILAVDNIKVVKLKSYDVTTNNFVNYRYTLTNSDVTPSFRVTNNGAETITALDVNYTFNGVTKTETVTGLNIPALSEGIVTLKETVQLPEAQLYDITFTINNPNGEIDENSTDDSGDGILIGVSSIPNRNIVIEEGTGTWCGWCPRGHVFMELMKETYPDDFIGIAAHNGDVMTIAEHDDGLNFSGYPSAHANRNSLDIDPSESEEYYNIEKALIVPFTAGIDIDFNDNTGVANITAKATPYSNMTGAEFRFSVIITEDEVKGTGNAYNQSNYYSGGGNGVMGGYEGLADPVPASQMVYEDVSRALLGGFDGEAGSISNSLVDGVEVTKNFTYTLPAGKTASHFRAAVLIIDSATGAIVNAAEDVFALPVNIFNAEVNTIETSIYPNPASDIALVKINIEETSDVVITIMDLTGRTVSSVNYGKAQGVSTFEMNVTDLNAGVYVVNVATDAGVSTQRLTVSK